MSPLAPAPPASAAPPTDPPEAKSARQALETFLHAVSHDLREPLRSLEGFSVALLEDYGPVLAGDGALYLQRIRGAVTRLTARLDGLLAVSRALQAPLAPEPCDVGAAFARAFAALAAAEPTRRVHLDLPAGFGAPADPALLQRLAEALAHNAWKFTRARAEAHVRLVWDPARAALGLRDDGAGFDARFAERIFAPFGRFHTEQEFEGLGLGLTLARQIAARHGGHLHAEGEVEGGATLWLHLPGLTAPPAPPAEDSQSP